MSFLNSCLRGQRIILIIALGLMLSACGGGGGGGSEGGGTTSNNGLTINTQAIKITATQNSPLPSTQSFSISWAGSNVAGVLVGVPAGSTIPSWVDISLTGSASPLTLTVGVNTTNLTPGNYTMTIRIVSGDSNGNLIGLLDIPLTYTVNADFAVTPQNLTFNYISGDVLPGAQNILLSGASGTSWTASASQPWITLSSNTGTLPTNVAVAANPASLQPGNYTASISFSPGGGGQAHVVTVTLTVKPQAISVSTATVDFNYIRGGAIPSSRSIDIAGTIGLNWTATADQGWLTLNSYSGTTPSTRTVSVNPNGLAPGVYTSTVTFVAGALSTSMVVTLTITDPVLNVSQTSLTFSGTNGAQIAPQTLNISLSNGATDIWNGMSDASWLVLGQANGITPGNVTVTVDPAVGALSSGNHSASITFVSTSGGVTVSKVVAVSLTLNKAIFSVNPTNIELGGIDGSDLSARSFQLALNTASNGFNWTVNSLSNWIHVSPSSGVASGTPVMVTVTPDAIGLSAGIHTGSITISSIVNGDAVSINVPVSLRLDPHKLFVHDNGVALVSSPTRVKLSQSITVRDNHDAVTPWQATSDKSWLTVTPAGSTPGTLTLTANPSGLSPDSINYATVTITSTDASIVNSGQEKIQVGFYVTATSPAEPATSTLLGTDKSTGLVADPVRPYVYVTHGGENIDIYNIYTGALENSIVSSGSDLRSLAISSDGKRLYAADFASYRLIVADLTANPPAVTAIWSNSTWSNCLGCNNTFAVFELYYTRLNGRPILVAAGPEIIDAITGERLVASTWSMFGYGLVGDVSGNGDTLFEANTNSAGHNLYRYNLHFNVPDNVVTATLTNTGGADGYNRGLSTNYAGSVVYRACWYPNEIESYDGNTLQFLSIISSGTNGGAIVGKDGLVYCVRYYSEGAAPGYVPDVWVYNPNTGTVETGREYNVLGEIGERQLVISGDGLRLITRSNNKTTLTSTTISP